MIRDVTEDPFYLAGTVFEKTVEGSETAREGLQNAKKRKLEDTAAAAADKDERPSKRLRTTREGRLVICSMNVHYWRDGEGKDNTNGIIQLLQQEQPDIVCLQECKQSPQVNFGTKGKYFHSPQCGQVYVLSKHELELHSPKLFNIACLI